MTFEEKQSELPIPAQFAFASVANQVNGAMPSTSIQERKALSLKLGKKSAPSDIVGKDYALWQGDTLAFLKGLPVEPMFDLVVTSPPYNIGKEYETRRGLEEYIKWQESIIAEIIPRLKKGGRTHLRHGTSRRSIAFPH